MNATKKIFQSFLRGPIYIILFGLIFFGIGAGLTFQQYIFRQGAVEVPGVVTGHTMGSCDDDGCSYRSVVSFETRDGKSASYTTSFSSSPPAYDVGEEVIVFYARENPSDAVLKGEGKVFRIIFTSIGGAIILFGMFFFASNVRGSFLKED